MPASTARDPEGGRAQEAGREGGKQVGRQGERQAGKQLINTQISGGYGRNSRGAL
jgi:hypothetical protein